MPMAQVLILIGSESDQEFADRCREQLEALGIEARIEVSSVHRQPERTAELARTAEEKGFDLIIAMAGLSAALPGVAAAHTNLPVIGVPLPAAIGGIDALLATVQMPPGIPVAAVTIGAPGAKNAAVLAARILGLKYPEIREQHEQFRRCL
ncbi:MAG: 5-(carboxyamino)imidazole ribonucleotide mutase [Candidatus Zixiibacteriota bacterium]